MTSPRIRQCATFSYLTSLNFGNVDPYNTYPTETLSRGAVIVFVNTSQNCFNFDVNDMIQTPTKVEKQIRFLTNFGENRRSYTKMGN